MNKNISTTNIDEMLVLCLLDEEQADTSEICDRISYLSGGAVAYDIRNAAFLYRIGKIGQLGLAGVHCTPLRC